jgi:cell wall-associated NlpC family hydrolase
LLRDVRRWCASALLVTGLPLLGLAPPAAADPGPPTLPQAASSLQIRAQQLAGQIRADGERLDELDGIYQAALMRYQQLSTRQSGLRGQMAATARQVAAARERLKQEAILAYITGGDGIMSYVPGRAGRDPSLMVSYAEIVAGGQQRAENRYRSLLAEQGAQTASLSTTVQQARIALADATTARAQAQLTLAGQNETLAQVKGRLALLVAQVEADQQRAEEAAVKAQLAAQGDLPPTTPLAPRVGAPPAAVTLPAATRPVVTTTTTTAPTVPLTNSTPQTTTTTNPPSPVATNQPAAGAQLAIDYAEAQLGKPYQWGGAGPGSFDCSGLVMMAWEQAGVYFPHLAQAQYDMTERVPFSDMLPGDLVFFGTPSDVHHVGLYIGNGEMIDAPETGQDVSIQSIYWSDLLAAGRVES